MSSISVSKSTKHRLFTKHQNLSFYIWYCKAKRSVKCFVDTVTVAVARHWQSTDSVCGVARVGLARRPGRADVKLWRGRGWKPDLNAATKSTMAECTAGQTQSDPAHFLELVSHNSADPLLAELMLCHTICAKYRVLTFMYVLYLLLTYYFMSPFALPTSTPSLLSSQYTINKPSAGQIFLVLYSI